MAFIDEIKFFAQAGKGGDGVVRWRREKYEDRGGPWGGDGGRGGDIYVEGARNIMILTRISQITRYKAENGSPGEGARRHGKNAEDLTIVLPTGSVITNTATGEQFELMEEGDRIRILEGGVGGYGNDHFKSSTNVAPQEATPGEPGEAADFTVELKLIAHAGLVGYPNAGKTSLLNILTNATAKVGDYPFTTLTPNLGVLDGHILADIPGIIEDASEGKGLGIKFLRHIARTKLIIHCISAERDDVAAAYQAIRRELTAYGQGIETKPEQVLITKKDLGDDASISEKVAALQAVGVDAFPVCIIDDTSVKELRILLNNRLQGL